MHQVPARAGQLSGALPGEGEQTIPARLRRCLLGATGGGARRGRRRGGPSLIFPFAEGARGFRN